MDPFMKLSFFKDGNNKSLLTIPCTASLGELSYPQGSMIPVTPFSLVIRGLDLKESNQDLINDIPS